MAPTCMVRFQRVSLYVRLLVKQQWTVLAMLWQVRARPKSFMFALQNDLRLLATYGEMFHACLQWSMGQWVQYILSDPKGFKKAAHNTYHMPILTLHEISSYDSHKLDSSVEKAC
eukprot:8773225-Karenia_brevis.AAC.1